MSEWVLKATSAKLVYTVPFTLVHAEKYRIEDKLKPQTIHKLNTTQKKQATQNASKQNYHGLVTFCDTQPGNKVGLSRVLLSSFMNGNTLAL